MEIGEIYIDKSKKLVYNGFCYDTHHTPKGTGQMNYNTPLPKKQGVVDDDFPLKLQDYTGSGRRAPWRHHKIMNELLSEAYKAVDVDKANRLIDCGNYMRFKLYDDGTKRLDRLNSCRVRLCPLCAWRRSLKTFHNTNQICMALAEKKNYRYVMLTLTVRNCGADELDATIDHLFQSWNRFLQYAAIKKACKGWMRTLEVTHNTRKDSPSYDSYHPHFHVLIAVNSSYFKSAAYISHKDWQAMWAKAARLNYLPDIDIRAIKKSAKEGLLSAIQDRDTKTAAIAAASAEVSKYASKPEDYIIPDDWDLTVDAVATLDQALANRRLIAYGGVMREMHRALHLEDEENGDLINVDNSEERADVYRLAEYFWFSGARPGDKQGRYRGRYVKK